MAVREREGGVARLGESGEVGSRDRGEVRASKEEGTECVGDDLGLKMRDTRAASEVGLVMTGPSRRRKHTIATILRTEEE